MEGFVKKRGSNWRTMKQRYFVLGDGRIEYLATKDGVKNGEVLLTSASTVDAIGRRSFNVKCPGGRTLECEAEDSSTRDAWMTAIGGAIKGIKSAPETTFHKLTGPTTAGMTREARSFKLEGDCGTGVHLALHDLRDSVALCGGGRGGMIN